MLRFLQASVAIEQRASEVHVRVRNRCEAFNVVPVLPFFVYLSYLAATAEGRVFAIVGMVLLALMSVSMLASREDILVNREYLSCRRTIAGIGRFKRYRLEDIRGLRVEVEPQPLYRGQPETWHGGYPRIWFDDTDGIIKLGRGLTVEDARKAVEAICAYQPRLCAGYVATKPGVVLTLGL